MTTVFLYGTLRHVALLECVLGRDAAQLDTAPDLLPGHAVLTAREASFPVLVEDAAQNAPGLVVRGLSGDDIARLDYYEAGFDYDLRCVTLASGEAAQVYFPRDAGRETDGPWALAAWQDRWAEMSVFAAQEVMEDYGTLPAEVIAARYSRIRARAWSRVLAKQGRHGAGVLTGRIEIIERKRAYSHFFALDDFTLRHETFHGGMSETLDRAVFVSSDAALVLPYDPLRDRVLLVEQIRLGPIGRHDPVVWQMEPIAGLVDPGEMPEGAAHREALEEAGLTFHQLEPVGAGYASPGASTDFFHMFVGLCDLPDTSRRVGGAEDEGENIRTHVMGFDALLAMAEDRRTANAPLTLLTYWLAHHRARLRAA